MEQFEKIIKEAAKEAGKLIKEKFGTHFSISHKDRINNLVTEVDKQSEQLIRSIINKNFPEHGIIGEEYEIKETKSRYKWVIDPIDGTTNFAHGVPICCVSIAFLDGDETMLGVVYNPMMDEFFFAKKGEGAYLNNQPISVSENAEFKKAFLVTGFPYHFDREQKDITQIFTKLVSQGLPIRRLGAAAIDLCWVACGRFDGFWEYKLQPWDVAAGYLMVEEAGGKLSNFKGEKSSIWDAETLATNGKIHDALLAILKD